MQSGNAVRAGIGSLAAVVFLTAGCTTTTPGSGGSGAKQVKSTVPVRNMATGAKVTVSSTHRQWPGEGPAEGLVDGDTQTRWASDYAEPQQVSIDLGRPVSIETLRLTWENAFATDYAVSTSHDGQAWVTTYNGTNPADAPDRTLNAVPMKDVVARHVRLELKKRVKPAWGFSLYEIEVLGRPAR